MRLVLLSLVTLVTGIRSLSVFPDKGAAMERWEGMWRRGVPPGAAFDAAAVEPAFEALLDGTHLPAGWDIGEPLPRGTAFVPGCGRGYSLVALAAAGFDAVTGLEIAPTAQQAATEFVATQRDHVDVSKIQVVVDDFFKYEGPPGGFDLVYDCTFLCAIPPETRQQWAAKMAELVKPGGEIVTLIFPVFDKRPDPVDGDVGPGPPFQMSPALVESLLVPAGFKQKLLEPVPRELQARSMASEFIARWTREP